MAHAIHLRDIRFCCGEPSCCCECPPVRFEVGDTIQNLLWRVQVEVLAVGPCTEELLCDEQLVTFISPNTEEIDTAHASEFVKV